MVGSGNTDWIFWLTGGLLAAAGFALLVWSLFRDRSRGRLRCPKCWYRMEGVPVQSAPTPPGEHASARDHRSWTCPECGRATLGERRLRKTRRRKRWAAVALLMLIAGWGSGKYPEARQRGLVTYIPTTALILTRDLAYKYGWGGSDVGAELLNRLDAGQVASWQLPLLHDQGLEGLIQPVGRRIALSEPGVLSVVADPPAWFHGDEERLLLVKARLPDAVEMAFRLPDRNADLTEWYREQGPVIDKHGAVLSIPQEEMVWRWDLPSGSWVGLGQGMRAGMRPTGMTEVVFDWELHRLTGQGPLRRLGPVVWSGVGRIPIELWANNPPRGPTPVASAALDSVIARLIKRVRPAADGHGLGVAIERPDDDAIADMTIAVRIELVFNGNVLSGVPVQLDPGDVVDPGADILKFDPTVVSLPAEPTDPRLVIRIRSLESAATFLGIRSTYWKGSVDIPLGEILAREPNP